jgi:glycosyltransferase involved in cell wall biosynthesis
MHVIRNLPVKLKDLTEGPALRRNGERLIIYQGALNMGRGLELAIRAMQYIENCRLLIAGSGYYEKELRELVLSLNVGERIRFLGRLRPEELLNYTVQADLGISLEENKGLNYYYALPNKLFDYIQAQIPVLVSDLPEMSAVINAFEVGKTTNTDDPHELASVINQMMTDEDLRNHWKQGLKKASAELCWENEEKKLLEIYRELIRDHAFLRGGK